MANLYNYIQDNTVRDVLSETTKSISQKVPVQLWDEVIRDFVIDLSNKVDNKQPYPLSKFFRSELGNQLNSIEINYKSRWDVKINKAEGVLC